MANKKLLILMSFVLLIAIVSGYYLWQIDKHEKALLGREWINPVPYTVWQKYLQNKDVHESVLARYKSTNPTILHLIQNYRQKYKITLDDLIQTSHEFRGEFNIPKSSETAFAKEYPEEFKNWQTIVLDLDSHRYTTPQPSNPPKVVIQQSINSYYRYMALLDGVLILCLILTAIFYKQGGSSPCD